MDFKSSLFMYCVAGVVILFVIGESLFFLIRAWRQGKSMGIPTEKMKNTIISSSLFSIAPALSVVATIVSLSAALGIVLPWIRLSVIGAVSYEVPAAQAALEALGITTGLSTPITDKLQFSTVAWIMTAGSVLPLVIIPFALKKIQRNIGKTVEKNKTWANLMSAAAFIGIIAAFISRAIAGKGDDAVLGDGAGVMSIVGLLSSIVFMLIIEFLIKKFPKLQKFESLAMPLAMFAAMGVIVLLTSLLPAEIANFEWRG